jgi:predicted nucleotidyltransferase
MAALPIELPREQIEAFCVRHRIRKLSLFGSVLTPRFRPTSDIDVLVEFEPAKGPATSSWLGWRWSFRICWEEK